MKKWLLILLLLCLFLSGCTHREAAQITATTLPVYEFTSALCEDTGLRVSRLVTEEVSCLHDYTLQVSQMQAVESAQVVVCNGAGLENFLEDALKKANRIVDASSDISLTCAEEHHHDGQHHEHDPHIWLSPENAKQMAETICAELTAIYPQHEDRFAKNLDALLTQLDSLQEYGQQQLKDLHCRNLITFHDGFHYFAESFDLHILKAVEEESGSEASAKELIEIIRLIEDNQLPAIFTEQNGSTAAANIISAETNTKVFTLDMAMSGNSYFEAMYRNIDTVKEALG